MFVLNPPIFLSFFSSSKNLPLCIKGGGDWEERRKGAFYGHPRVDLFKTAGSLQAISKNEVMIQNYLPSFSAICDVM